MQKMVQFVSFHAKKDPFFDEKSLYGKVYFYRHCILIKGEVIRLSIEIITCTFKNSCKLLF